MYDSKVNLIQCSVSVCDALNCKIERTWIDVELNIETCEEILLLPGFLGLCTLLLLWPGLVILHVTKVEELVWPDSLEWAVLFINGIVGVVISNLLWLWLVVVICHLCRLSVFVYVAYAAV